MMRRRDLLRGLGAAGTVGMLGARPSLAAEPAPETKRIRLIHRPSLCEAPNYVAEELLQGEGFTDIQYLKRDQGAAADLLASGGADISTIFAPPMILRVDAGEPIVFLSGLHIGCAQLIANERVRTLTDLRGKKVAITAPRDVLHTFVASVAAHVGLKPDTDIAWVTAPTIDHARLLTEGKVDAIFAGPPHVQELRARKIGTVILDFLTDRPWSQYYCCMVVANREFARRHPIAAKRALRAILKASNVCAAEPERIARFMVEKGYAERSDYAVQAMKEIVYGKWRDYDPVDTIRFYSLRLHEAGMIRSTPQRILAQGTDWRFVNELKKEMKG